MSAWERERGALPAPTFGPVGRKTGGPVCFLRVKHRSLRLQARLFTRNLVTTMSPSAHQSRLIARKTSRFEKLRSAVEMGAGGVFWRR
jgi:hypothetical protein